MEINVDERLECVKCHSKSTFLLGGLKDSSTNNCFVIMCQDCKHEHSLTEEEAMKYGEAEFEKFKKLITFDKYTVENLKMLSDNGFDGYVYYKGEGGGHETHGLNEVGGRIDSKYNDMEIESISLYDGWIHISIYDGEPMFELREY